LALIQKAEEFLRILIADDHEVVRKGVCVILSTRPDLEVCAEAADGQEAIMKALETNPDLIILDVSMPKLDGISAARKLKELFPSVPIIILSMLDELEIVDRVQQAGAQAFVPKAEAANALLQAVDSLTQG
jgi:DNA-binding NarL/FixJ family response regulator